MHFQKTRPQGKLVRAIEGEVFDAAVDLRQGSPTCGKWHAVVLSGEKRNMLYIPAGFAHGFLVLSDIAVFAYKCTDFYYPEDPRFSGVKRHCGLRVQMHGFLLPRRRRRDYLERSRDRRKMAGFGYGLYSFRKR